MKELDKAAQAAVREINRKLITQIRNDFEFPDPSALPDGVPELEYEDPGIPSSSGANKEKAAEEARKVKKPLRERYYGTTDDSSEDEAHLIEDMYAFDSPDTVGDELDRKVTERRKRKRKDMDEELRYNSGLCFFQRRRNVWTGAIPKTDKDGRKGSGSSAEEGAEKKTRLATSSDSSPVRTPTSIASAVAEDPAATTANMEGVEPTSDHAPPQFNEWIPPSHYPAFKPPQEPSDLTDILIPVSPPLVPPSNPVRISLASRSQSELYTKIVRDSRTPAIPVNLADMTRIIVQGWKDEGNWPPRGTAPEASFAQRRPGTANRVSRAIGVRDEGILAHHPHLQRGVEGMKRVFRLSGSNHGEPGSPKSPQSPKVKGDVGSAFRSHE